MSGTYRTYLSCRKWLWGGHNFQHTADVWLVKRAGHKQKSTHTGAVRTQGRAGSNALSALTAHMACQQPKAATHL